VLGNLLAFLALVALLVLFGWLTLRAWRIQRLLYKIPALLLSGLLSLVFLVVVFVAAKGLAFAYIAPGPAPDLSVAGSPDQIARGEYLVNVACVGCHGADGCAADVLESILARELQNRPRVDHTVRHATRQDQVAVAIDRGWSSGVERLRVLGFLAGHRLPFACAGRCAAALRVASPRLGIMRNAVSPGKKA